MFDCNTNVSLPVAQIEIWICWGDLFSLRQCIYLLSIDSIDLSASNTFPYSSGWRCCRECCITTDSQWLYNYRFHSLILCVLYYIFNRLTAWAQQIAAAQIVLFVIKGSQKVIKIQIPHQAIFGVEMHNILLATRHEVNGFYQPVH